MTSLSTPARQKLPSSISMLLAERCQTMTRASSEQPWSISLADPGASPDMPHSRRNSTDLDAETSGNAAVSKDAVNDSSAILPASDLQQGSTEANEPLATSPGDKHDPLQGPDTTEALPMQLLTSDAFMRNFLSGDKANRPSEAVTLGVDGLLSLGADRVLLDRLCEHRCEVCDKRATSKDDLEEHRSIAGHYKCNRPNCCGKVFPNAEKLAKHLSSSHPSRFAPPPNPPLRPSMLVVNQSMQSPPVQQVQQQVQRLAAVPPDALRGHVNQELTKNIPMVQLPPPNQSFLHPSQQPPPGSFLRPGRPPLMYRVSAPVSVDPPQLGDGVRVSQRHGNPQHMMTPIYDHRYTQVQPDGMGSGFNQQQLQQQHQQLQQLQQQQLQQLQQLQQQQLQQHQQQQQLQPLQQQQQLQPLQQQQQLQPFQQHQQMQPLQQHQQMQQLHQQQQMQQQQQLRPNYMQQVQMQQQQMPNSVQMQRPQQQQQQQQQRVMMASGNQRGQLQGPELVTKRMAPLDAQQGGPPAKRGENDVHLIGVKKRGQQTTSANPNMQPFRAPQLMIHLNESTTPSVRQPPSGAVNVTPISTRPKTKSDAKAKANVLASRDITLTLTAGGDNGGGGARLKQVQQQRPAPPPAVATLNLSSEISLIPTVSGRGDQGGGGFAVPQNRSRQPQTYNVEGPPKLETVDLTDDGPKGGMPHPNMVRGRRGHPPVSCHICDKVFTTQASLEQHMQIHRAPRTLPHRCDLCTAQFPTQRDLLQHRQVYHNVPVPGPELALPIVDLKQPGVRNRLSNLGIVNYIPLSQLSSQQAGCFGLPIVSVDVSSDRGVSNLSLMGVTNILSLGPIQPLQR